MVPYSWPESSRFAESGGGGSQVFGACVMMKIQRWMEQRLRFMPLSARVYRCDSLLGADGELCGIREYHSVPGKRPLRLENRSDRIQSCLMIS